MALTNNNESKPFIELTQGAKKELEDIGKALERSKGDIKAFESIGVKAPVLNEMVEMGEKMLKVVLDRFT